MIKITLPGIPPSLNVWSRMHWAKRAKEKKYWEEAIIKAFIIWKCENKKLISTLEKAKVRISFYFKTHARHDCDNMNLKFLLDGLVKAGIIEDDNIDVIGQVEICTGYDKNNPRVEIEVWEVQNVS